MSTNVCPFCGMQNAPQARFCARCGKVLVAAAPPAPTPEAVCPRCKNPIRSTARFCGVCGYDLAQALAGQAQEATPMGAPLAAGTPAGAPAAPLPPVGGPGEHGQAPHTVFMGDNSPSGGTLIVRWMGGNSQRYPLNKPVVTVGRAPDNDVVINHPAVSGHHLSLMVRPEGMALTDLNSTNGTQVNGQRIQPNQPLPIQFADVIRLGDLTGNWVSLAFETAAGEALRTLSLGKLDLANQTNIIIGRDPSSYLPLNHPAVSFRHAQIVKQDGGLLIRDLNSTNGTYVNSQRITQAPLKSGDEIQIGPFKLVYDAQAMVLAQSMHMGHRIDAIKLGREVQNRRMILRNVSVTVNPGEFVALVGGSGAGKSTLMKAMNGYEPANHGHLLLDGEPLYSKLELYRTQMGYVPQDDIIHRSLPVKTALYYAAKLRLPDARPAEIKARIADALRAVEMTEHADKPVRVLSGGQRKRVSIAVELLARPTLFFLDEPTSGLDPGLEKKMMYDLNRLADEGRTVVLVTHATANIEQCDHVAFLSQGRLSYYGPPNEALQFFGVRDFSDIYLKLSQDVDPAKGKPIPNELQPYYQPNEGKVQAGVLWAEHFNRSPHFQKYVADRQKVLRGKGPAAVASAAPPPRRSKDSFLRQTIILARRQFDLIRFDWRTLAILLLMVPLISMLFAGVSLERDLVGMPGDKAAIKKEMERRTQLLVDDWVRVELPKLNSLKEEDRAQNLVNYLNDDVVEDANGDTRKDKTNYLPVENAQTLVTMLALALTQAGTFVAAYEIVKERAIFRRERAVNLSVIAYVLSKVIVLGIFAGFQVISALIVIGFAVDLGFKGAIFDVGVVELFITLYLSIIASIIFGLFISAIVPNTDVVLYAILVQLFVQIILGGTLFPLDSPAASSTTVAYWATDAFGSTVNMPYLNETSFACSGEPYSDLPTETNPNPPIKYRATCSSATDTLPLKYAHTPGHVQARWFGLSFHIFMWFVLTIIIQARKKGE